jgi:hypothetical protein
MPLTQDQENVEHELRVEGMTVQIDNGRLNMKKLESDLKWETRKFVLQAVVAGAALLGAGAAIGSYLERHSSPPATVSTKP